MNWLVNRFKKFSNKKPLSAAMLNEATLERAEEELKILRDDFVAALSFFKKNYRNSGTLPLYIIIGESGFGKTTLLANSGMNLQTIYGNKVQDEFSTKYCTWLFSLQAIFLDTAGVYTKADKENPHGNLVWLSFLQLLRGHFGSNVITGIIVVIDTPTLAGPPAKLHRTLEDIKERLYEVAHYVEKLPVFLAFTKADLIPGFAAFFDDLSLEERQQLCGISFVNDYGISCDPQVNFPNAFNRLVNSLQKRLLKRMQQEESLTQRVNMQHFLLQIVELRSSITTVLNELPHGGHIELHGLYFVSALQNNAQVDYLMSKLWHALQLPSVASSDSGSVVDHNDDATDMEIYSDDQQNIKAKNSKCYFIDNFFKKELLLQQRPSLQKNKCHWMQIILISSLSLLMVIASLFWYKGYTKNIVIFNNVAKIMQHASHQQVDQIAQLEQTIAYLDEQLTFGGPYFGLNQVKKLAAAIDKTYYQKVAVSFIPLLQKTLEEELTGTDATEHQYLYATLKAYLMLGDANKLDVFFVQKWFEQYWREKIAINPLVAQHLALRLKIVLRQGLKIVPAEQIIATTREILSSHNIPKENFVYEKLENLYKKQQLHFKFANKTIDIPKLYTEDNFDRVYKKEIPKLAYNLSHNSGDWVLSNMGKKVAAKDSEDEEEQPIIKHGELDKLISSLRTLYIKHYIYAWSEATAQITLPKLSSLKETERFLKEVNSGDYPLIPFIKIAQLNLNLHPMPDEFAQTLADAHMADWRNIDLKNIYAALGNLVTYISQVTNSHNVSQAAFKIATLRFQAAENSSSPDAITTLRTIAFQQPQLVKNWLQNIAAASWHALLSEAQNYIRSMWESSITPEYKKFIDNTYPFFKDAPNSISLQDFTKFFSSKGIMDSFFNTYLRPFVDTEQIYWVWKNVDGQTLGFEQDKLEIFIRAALIRKMLYANNDSIPEIKFYLTMQALTPNTKQVVLRLGNQVAHYAKGEKISNVFTWPGDNPSVVSITFTNNVGKTFTSTMPQDSWAWFKLLDTTNFRIVDKTQRFSFTVDLNGNAVQYELYTEQPINPFIPDIINNFRCPDKL